MLDHALPAHRTELHEGWSVWRWSWLRGAGFPARGVLELGAPDAAAACDGLALATRAAAEARAAAVVAVQRLPPSKAVSKVLRALQRGELPADLTPVAAAGDALARLVEAEARSVELRAQAERACAAAGLTIEAALRRFAGDPRFREALRWQNKMALRTADWLFAHAGETNARARQSQALIASYAQRYCVKNDTIGFFGPVGWARLTDAATPIRVTPGPTLLDKRTVYFEHWCIDALAQTLATDPGLRPAMRPRRMPTVRLEGRVVFYPVKRRSTLPAPFAALLAACDGTRTAADIAATLVADPEHGLGSADEVYELLDALVQKRLCTWSFEIPTVTEWPERHLRRLLEAATGDSRARALAALDTLEASRAEVQAAAGDAVRLDAALTALEQTFEALTQQSASRRGGEVYAARTLVFEDCRRAIDVELGRPVRDRLGPPLALLLHSARWYTHRTAELFREALVDVFREVAGEATTIDYLDYWTRANTLFPAARQYSPLIARAVAELQARWGALVTWAPDARRVDLASSALAAPVREAFAAPQPGWPGARYHAPDVMIAAPSVDAIAAGQGLFVLGELHPSVSTMHFVAQKEHDDREALVRARELDLPRSIPWPVIPKESASRADHMWVSRQDVDIEFGTTPSWRPRESVIAVGELVAELVDGRVWIRDRAGRHRFEAVEFFGAYLSAAIATEFDAFPYAQHLPRITIDDLVIAREQWRFKPDEIEFATLEQGPAQLAAARTWARAHGLPRLLFVKIPEEPKPVYVDLESPLYVEMFARTIRKASRVTLSEMLPRPDEVWLPDAHGEVFACEMRLLAVDPVEWTPPGDAR